MRIARPQGRPRPRLQLEYKWIVLINTTFAMFMSSLDGSILTIALPDITRSINISVVQMMWTVMGFQLVITALLLPIARLADMKGRVLLYNVGFAIFTVTSALCGMSHTGTQLVIFRLLQGIGAALLSANSVALVTDAFPPSERGFALGINQMVGLSGFMMGTILGGILTEFVGWRYIFFLNVPLGTFATLWAFFKLHEVGRPETSARFDIGGMLTFPLGIGSVLAALTLVVMGEASHPATVALVVAGITLLTLFFYIERRVAWPMMDLSLFRIRIFLAGNASLLLNSLARGSTMFIMSWYFQTVLKDQPLIAGLKMVPLVLTMIISSPIAGRLSDRLGSRLLSTTGLAMTLIGQLCMTRFPLHGSYMVLAPILIVLGLGNGLFNSPNTSAVMGSVPANRRGIAAGTRVLLMNTGQTTSIATAMAILATVMSYQLLSGLFTGAIANNQALDALAFMQGMHRLYLFGAATAVVAIVCSSMRGSDDKRERVLAPVKDIDSSLIAEAQQG
jgi:EmrB/QacA subfamily drug resistance transporter